MTNFNYPEPLEDIDHAINHWAQVKTETGAASVAEKVAEIEFLLKEKLAQL
ncbi:MAG: hypothetical protein OXG85_03815 [Chloroflexi bacterium]|nr:hypothetical protein [Chloroflexota bacterium]